MNWHFVGGLVLKHPRGLSRQLCSLEYTVPSILYIDNIRQYSYSIGTTGIGQNDMLMYSSCQCHHCWLKLVKTFCYQSWTFTCCPNQNQAYISLTKLLKVKMLLHFCTQTNMICDNEAVIRN